MADWSNAEIDLIIEDYFSMLRKELSNAPLNKTQHRNLLMEQLKTRTKGSIEFKHQNISAVMIKLGLPFIQGYKPAWNHQQILFDKVVTYLAKQKGYIEPLFKNFADIPAPAFVPNFDFKTLVEEAPEKTDLSTKSKIKYKRKPFKINYLQREQNNTSLGEKGEAFVLEYEKWRLIQAGKESLADRIEWIAEHDDGAGFDILSKNENGTDRYIEVKTTKLGKYTPIFFSSNEYEFSKKNAKEYHLYRLYNFTQEPKMFNLRGDFDSFCSKEAIQYRGYF